MKRSAPYCRILLPEHVRRIDQTGRRILEEIGIRVLDSTCLDIMRAAGAQVDSGTQTVRFGADILDELLGNAPSRFTLCSRDSRNDVDLGGGRVYFANGGRVFRILDMSTGGYRPTILRDVAHTATLVNHLEHIDFYIIACQAHDLPPQGYHLNDFFQALNHTTKHVMGGCDDLEGVRQVWELASLIAGGENSLRDRPLISVITNPMSPLTIDSNTLSILGFCASHGIPVTCAPAPIAGATSPATLAGTLAQMHAEALAGVAIAQVLAPGARVLYGAVPTNMDMRTMEFTMGSVEMGMMNAAAVQLAGSCHIPIYATGGVTEAKRPDIQAGFEKNFSNLMVAMSGADCVHMAAGMLDSGNSISYEHFAIDNENIGMIKRILAGIAVNEDTLGFDVIESVGPGGAYVMEEHTVKHMMSEYFYPQLSVRSNFDIWEERGRPDMLSRSHELVRQVLSECEDCQEGLLDFDLINQIRERFPGIRNV